MDLGYSVSTPAELGVAVAMFAAMGGLSAVMANRGVTVFHDGLRPIIPSLLNGELSRKEVSATSWALAWGFLWSFGLPYSLGFVIPLVYLIFIFTDWVGVSTPADHKTPWYKGRNLGWSLRALLLGAGYGAALALALHFIAKGMDALPIDMAEPVRLFAQPVLGAFWLFAVLTAAYHFGVRRCVPTLAASSLAWFVASGLELDQPMSWAFGAGFIVLLVQLAGELRASRTAVAEEQATTASWATADDDDEASDEEAAFFAERVARIKKAIVPIVALAAISGAAYNWGIVTKDPIAGELYRMGLALPAFFVALAWAFAFVPMKFTTAVVTGVMTTGTFLDAGVAYLMPNPWAAAIAVGALKVVEIYALIPVVRLIDKYPSIRELADVMRTAIFHVMEIGFLIGGALAAARFGAEWGVAVVVGAWFINQKANSPVMPISVGAFAALVVGLIANLLHVLGVAL